ncbi:MAG: serine/threonine-protein phosphatase [Anaerolineae bacterium]|nr:serine/threonine-protein phosphatase [Anaerolineae bacterium]
MNLLRRVLGLTRQSDMTTSDEEVVSITYGDEAVLASPPEPIIEAPTGLDDVPDEEHTADSADVDNKLETVELIPDFAGTRPLPPLEAVVPKPGQRITFGQLSDVGMVRGNNQDAMFSMLASGSSSDDLPDFGLFIVADGMGGHHDGEKASAITARIVTGYVSSEILTPLLNHEMDDPDRPTITDVLRAAVQQANTAVTERIPEGGTTITMAAILGDLVYIAHVGDSRAYMITDEGIEQITRDHSLVQRLIELDQLTPEEAAEHPQRNVLYRAIGQNESLDVDAITRRLPRHARLLLCSDGLWNLVSEDTILSVVTSCADAQEACNKLVGMANDRGGTDNITIILVQMPG